MKTVLRNSDSGEITHVNFCTINGVNIYLSKSANDKMLNFGKEQVDEYFSGEPSDEVDSLKEDISEILTGELNPEVLKYRIAISIGFIDKNDVLEISM